MYIQTSGFQLTLLYCFPRPGHKCVYTNLQLYAEYNAELHSRFIRQLNYIVSMITYILY